ncbi:MAG: transcriptional regulator [SAR86 cluster bacterium]|uniref:Transcriptional regulator n=1 Tax=SAR86 cluster bacterium TaxID=2030880 RepID=A0A2A4MIX2_9GAMM|nr:MAG: transcriptional regulator [SAR86 cluster bacterium]
MINRLIAMFQYSRWPIVCGILAAVVILQYQQLEKLSQLGTVATLPIAIVTEELSFAQAIELAAPSVVSIHATRVNVEGVEQTSQDEVNFILGEKTSLGSGVIISDKGFILTNFHVIETLFNAFNATVTLNDGRSIPASVVAWDSAEDLAVLHINMQDLQPIELGELEQVSVGDVVFAIGYPRNIGQSVSQGIVSALGINQDPASDNYVIQTDASINPGNSGGALINRQGLLIGINSSIFSESGHSEGIGFATPATTAVKMMQELVDQAIAEKPGYLGVITGEILNVQSSQLFFGVPNIRGMLVEHVDIGGPAELAGILPGDVITQVEDTKVVKEQDIILEIINHRPGDNILVQVYRNGQLFKLNTVLGFGQAIVYRD